MECKQPVHGKPKTLIRQVRESKKIPSLRSTSSKISEKFARGKQSRWSSAICKVLSVGASHWILSRALLVAVKAMKESGAGHLSLRVG